VKKLRRGFFYCLCYFGYVVFPDVCKSAWAEVLDEQHADIVQRVQDRGISVSDFYELRRKYRALYELIEKCNRFSFSQFRSIIEAQRALYAGYQRVMNHG